LLKGVSVSKKIAPQHHAEGLVNPKVLAKKPVTDFRYPASEHVDSEKPNRQLF
jgi:hypothetical protein